MVQIVALLYFIFYQLLLPTENYFVTRQSGANINMSVLTRLHNPVTDICKVGVDLIYFCLLVGLALKVRQQSSIHCSSKPKYLIHYSLYFFPTHQIKAYSFLHLLLSIKDD